MVLLKNFSGKFFSLFFSEEEEGFVFASEGLCMFQLYSHFLAGLKVTGFTGLQWELPIFITFGMNLQSLQYPKWNVVLEDILSWVHRSALEWPPPTSARGLLVYFSCRSLNVFKKLPHSTTTTLSSHCVLPEYRSGSIRAARATAREKAKSKQLSLTGSWFLCGNNACALQTATGRFLRAPRWLTGQQPCDHFQNLSGGRRSCDSRH